MRDGREENEAGLARSVVLLRERMSDEVGEFLFESSEAGLVAEGFVVAEEREDDVRLGKGEVLIGVPNPAERSRSVSSSPEKPRFRMTSCSLGKRT